MELQALLVLCGVGVAGVAVLLLMSLFSSSGTSYEEAIAQQRKSTAELIALAESKNKNNKKSNKKAIKKQAKKEKKESAAVSTSSDHESEAPAESGLEDEPLAVPTKVHVDFKPPVVVDVPKDALPNVKPQEKVEEPVEKKEAKAPKTKAKGAAPKPAPPVEAVKEEVRERRDSGDAPKEQRKAKKAEKKSEKPVEEIVEERKEVVLPLNVPEPADLTTEKLLKQAMEVAPVAAAPAPVATPAVSTPTGGKKKKKNEPNVLTLMAGDSSGVNVGELERVIRAAPLSGTEIQVLTEALLNKHHDPLPKHSEWSEGPNDPMQKLKKQLAETQKNLSDEAEASKALQAKLKELREQLNKANREISTKQREADERLGAAGAELNALQARVARLAADNDAHARETAMLQQKLAAEGEAQAQKVQMEMHIQRLAEGEAALLQQIAALQAEMGAHVMDASAARDACLMAQQHASEMAQQLQEANRACNDLEQQRQLAMIGEQRAQQEGRVVQERLAAMGDVQKEVQRLSSHVQTVEANAEKAKEEAEKLKQQLTSEIASLREQLVSRETELAEVKQLKAAPAQNGLPQEQHKVAELAAVESVVEALREELSAAQRASREQGDQLADLTRQLAAYREKNNEALTKAEEAHYTEVVGVLRGACPAAAPGSAAGREWLRAFADNLKKELQKRDAEKLELEKRVPEKVIVEKVVEKIVERPVEDRPDGRVRELQEQNKQLQAELEKYRGAIEYTEKVLSQLQHNVSREEERWARQLEDKQRELDEVRATLTHQMKSKIEALESQLAQAKTTNHSHSFADAERQTEERLMAGLSDKHSLDVCNGPSQVGLEEK